MKKGLSLILLFGLIIFSAANVFAVITVDLKCSNALPDGNDYATVTIEQLTGGCSGGYNGVKITVDANQSVLLPGSNFGIQKFGFNYNGNHEDMVITVYEEDGTTVDPSWNVKHGQNMSEFGCFVEEPTGTGHSRHEPLIIKVCKPNTNLIAADFNVPNGDGYNFAAHIADFTYGTNYYGTNSAYFANCPPSTLITLTSFTATAGNGSVKLEWETATELNNAGFNILRARRENGDYIQINEDLILPKGSGIEGASYEFIDTSVRNGKTYWYKLQDVELGGTTTDSGPVKATPRRSY